MKASTAALIILANTGMRILPDMLEAAQIHEINVSLELNNMNVYSNIQVDKTIVKVYNEIAIKYKLDHITVQDAIYNQNIIGINTGKRLKYFNKICYN